MRMYINLKHILLFALIFTISLFYLNQRVNAHNYDSLWSVWNDVNLPDTSRMQAMKEISWNTTLRISADSGFEVASEMLDFAKERNSSLFQAIALKTMGLASYFKGNYNLALDYYKLGLQKAIDVNEEDELSKIYNNIGVTQKALGNYDSALVAHQRSLDIKINLNQKKGMAISYNNMGVIYSIQENLPMAMEYFYKNLRICEELNFTRRTAEAYQNIGLIYLQQENYEKALENFKNSEVSFKTLNHTRGLCPLYNNMGVVYKDLNDLVKAQHYYELALELGTKINDRKTISNVYRNLGNIYFLKQDFITALEYFNKYLTMRTEMGDKNSMIAAHIDIGMVYLEINEPLEAIEWCRKAYRQAKQYEYLENIMNSCKCLNSAYNNLGNTTYAYKYQEEYYFTRDSIDKLENQEEVTRLVMQYEYEKQFLEDSLAMAEQRLQTELTYQKNLNKEKNKRNLAYIVGTAVLILAGILFGWLGYYRRNNKRLAEKNVIIEREKNRAEESERSKERFFSNVSHEFRTPLTLIMGPLDNLISRVKSEELKHDLGIMQRNANRLYSMINELLNLYKLESGEIKLNAGKIDIVGFVNRHIQSFESLATQRELKLSFSTDFPECFIYADKEKLDKILSNLLSNAFKFTGKGGQVRVKLKYEENDKNSILVSVSDTGIGIPKDELESVFDRFYQVDDSDKRGYEGTGIGLALSRELVELHKGSIWVTSELNEGSTFCFRLPVGAENFEDEVITEEDTEEFDTPKIEIAALDEDTKIVDVEVTSKERLPILLIVEDNADLRSYIRSCFDKAEYKIVEARDGEQGLTKAIEKIPDLIISDIMMPVMDGNEMCEKIKTDERTSHIPVVLVTARSSVEQKIKGIETGADAYISKPFHAKELQAWVKKLIEQRKKLRQSFMKSFHPGIELPTEDVPNVDQQFIQKAVNIVEENISDPDFNVEKFGREMAMSRVQLHRKLTALTDQSASRFVRTIRLKKAADFLKTRQTNIKETAYMFGFNNQSYFDKCFHKEFEMTPSEYIAIHNS